MLHLTEFRRLLQQGDQKVGITPRLPGEPFAPVPVRARAPSRPWADWRLLAGVALAGALIGLLFAA
jgi:hypothetical protein